MSLRQTSPCGPGLRVIAFLAALRPVNRRVRPTVNCRFGSSNSTRACGFAALPVLLSPLTWPVVTFTPPQSLGLNLLRFNGSTLGSDYSPHSLRPTSGIWRFSDPLLVVAAGCCCVVCAQSDSPIRSRIVLSTCVESSTVYRRIVRPNHRPLDVSSSPRRHPVCATSPPRCWFLLACVVGSPPRFACCHVVYHPVRLVLTRCRRRRRNRLVLSKLLRCCQLPSDILVPVRFLGQRFLFNPGQLQSPILHSLHSRERPCRRCVQLSNLVRL